MKELQELINRWKQEAARHEADQMSPLLKGIDRLHSQFVAGQLRLCITEAEFILKSAHESNHADVAHCATARKLPQCAPILEERQK